MTEGVCLHFVSYDGVGHKAMSKTLSVRISDELYENVLQRMKEDNATLSDIVIQALERELLKGSVVSRLERAVERLEKLDKKPIEALSKIKRSKTPVKDRKPVTGSEKANHQSIPTDVEMQLKGDSRIQELVNEIGNVPKVNHLIAEILNSEGILTGKGLKWNNKLVGDRKVKIKNN